MTATTIDRSSARPAPWARLDPTGDVRSRTRPVVPGPLVFHRRRVAVAVLLMVAAFTAGILIAITLLSSPAGGSLTDDARRAEQVSYVVQPGDTLWRAAARLAPDADPRAVVDALSASRGTSELRPGEVLVWPLG